MAEDIAKRIYDLYISRGLTPTQAAAMTGQMMAESGGHPTIQETKADGTPGPGWGAMQWTTPSRRAGLDAFAKDRPWVNPRSLEGQVDYSLHELDTTEADAGKKLYAAQNYGQAVDAATGYTRPQGYTPGNPTGAHNYQGRYNFGASLAGVPQISMPPPTMGGSQNVSGGLLGPQGIDAEIADWSKMGQDPASRSALNSVLAADAAKTAAANAGIASAGSSLGKSMIEMGTAKPPPQMQLKASIHQPQQLAAMPNFAQQGGGDFAQQLAQARLGGAFGKKKLPWEEEE